MTAKQQSKLQVILDNEGITKTELVNLSGVNYTTISGLCKGVVLSQGKVVENKIVTLSKIMHAINGKIGYVKYSFEDIFPTKSTGA